MATMLNTTPNNFNDTGPAPPHLAPSMRALQTRIRIFEAEQAATYWAAERHYEQANALFEAYIQNQPRLRKMREVRLNRGRS